ncbi:MAG: hypothetical protein K2L02_01925 [Clostridia bacterium]|nr:hypothetical protein [Clostridia bacterium]
MIKKLLSISAALVMGLCLFCGCNDPEEIEDKPFYTLEEAYKYGWLSKNDLKSIAYYHNGGRKGNEGVMSKNYTPKPKTPEVLDDATTMAIKQAYYDVHTAKGYLPTITLDEVGFRYYGWYNGCAVIKIGYRNMPVSDVLVEEKVGGIKVSYSEDWVLSVWRQKEI